MGQGGRGRRTGRRRRRRGRREKEREPQREAGLLWPQLHLGAQAWLPGDLPAPNSGILCPNKPYISVVKLSKPPCAPSSPSAFLCTWRATIRTGILHDAHHMVQEPQPPSTGSPLLHFSKKKHCISPIYLETGFFGDSLPRMSLLYLGLMLSQPSWLSCRAPALTSGSPSLPPARTLPSIHEGPVTSLPWAHA